MTKSPFNSPVPGQSLTDETGTKPWETPPTYATADDALDFALSRLDDEDNLNKIIDLVGAGVPVETIVNTWGIQGFTRGDFTPDVAEMVKPSLALAIMDQALNKGIAVRMFNEDVEAKPTEHFADALEVMKNARPRLFDKFKRDSGISREDIPDEEGESGFLKKRDK
jgi:hypothetical protein